MHHQIAPVDKTLDTYFICWQVLILSFDDGKHPFSGSVSERKTLEVGAFYTQSLSKATLTLLKAQISQVTMGDNLGGVEVRNWQKR